jgi:hypothetical protein
MDVANNHRSEDTGSVAMGFRQNCGGEEKNPCDACPGGIFKQKNIAIIFLARAFLPFYTST